MKFSLKYIIACVAILIEAVSGFYLGHRQSFGNNFQRFNHFGGSNFGRRVNRFGFNFNSDDFEDRFDYGDRFDDRFDRDDRRDNDFDDRFDRDDDSRGFYGYYNRFDFRNRGYNFYWEQLNAVVY